MRRFFTNNSRIFMLLCLLFISGTPLFAQPCVPNPGGNGCSDNDDVDNFILYGDAGTSIVDMGTGCSGSGAYDNRTNESITLTQAGFYSVNISTGYPSLDNVTIWIDYNDDDIFTSDEIVTTYLGVTLTGSDIPFTIPAAALIGTHTMRVAMNYNIDPTTADPCQEASYGEYVDYTVVIEQAFDCSGTPAAGTVISNFPSVCPANSITLNASGYTVGLGLTYQWISSPAGAGTFTAILGATVPYYSTSGQTVATDYGFVVSCSNSGLSDTALVTVQQNATYLCSYCTGLNNYNYDAPINGVAIAGTTLNNQTPGNANIYQQFAPSGNTTGNMEQGALYTITINAGDQYGDPVITGVWIDYDQSGTYDAGEYTAVGDNINGTVSASILVPSGALTGLTGMRVRATYEFDGPMGAGDACTFYYDGSVQDYEITIDPGVPCTGTPVAGTAVASNTTTCPVTNFNLSATGFTTGLGISYQWESSPAGAGTFTPIAGATSPVYTVTDQEAATDYQLVVTCANGPDSNISNIVSVAQTPAFICSYCSGLNNALNEDYYEGPLDSVAIAGTTLNNYIPNNTTEYAQFPAVGNYTANLQQGAAYTMYIHGDDGFDPVNTGFWIDYDQSGTFDDNEFTAVGTSVIGLASSSFVVPSSAVVGLTGMRVRSVDIYDGNMGSGDACNFFYEGTTQDYLITIDPGVPCAGQPVAGTTVPSLTTVCPNTPFTLAETGFTSSLGISYQWQSSPAGAGTFTDITGATSPTYSVASQLVATDYRFVISCVNSLLGDTSVAVSVAETPFLNCYCNDQDSYSGDSPIDSFSIAGTTLNNYTPGNTDIYDQYPATGNTTAHLLQGDYYTLYINSDGGEFQEQVVSAVWIDYNQDGTFTSDEYIPVATTPSLGTMTASFIVPSAALVGQTGLRVRVVPSYEFWDPQDPCAQTYGGSTQDYIITIDPGVPCTGTPTAGIAAASTTTACPSSPFNLTASGFSSSLNISYQWEVSPAGAGTFVPIPGASTINYTVTDQEAASDYQLVVTCTNGPDSAISNIISIAETPSYICSYCSGLNNNLNEDYFDAPLDSVYIAGTTLNNNIPNNTTVYQQFPPVGNTTADLQQGNFYTVSIYSSDGFGDAVITGIWIDYDQNGTFDDYEYTAVGTDVTATASASFLVPAAALTGPTGMRVRATDIYDGPMGPFDACSFFYEGSTQDYIINITPGVPCAGQPEGGVSFASVTTACPTSPFTLTDTGFTTGIGLIYQWQSSPTGANTWTDIAGANSPTYTAPGQTVASDYRFMVTCTNSSLADSSALVTVNQNPFYLCYCSPLNGTQLVEYGGDNVMEATAVTPSTLAIPYTPPPSNGYLQLLAPPQSNTADLTIGVTYTVAFNSYLTFLDDAGVWIDYDHSGTFDVGEYTEMALNATADSYTVNITIPAIAISGLTGMRITGSEDDYLYDACEQILYGEVQDFVVNIISACDTVQNLAVNGITLTGATVNWDVVTGAAGYEVVVDANATDPTGAGTPVTAPPYTTTTALNPGTTYYVHVRTDCDGTNSSTWETLAFTTPVCDTVLNAAVVSVTATGVTISWNSEGNATAYNYQLDQTATAPASSGATTTDTTFSLTGLLPCTAYYGHIRVNCGGGYYSGWIAVPFTTPCCDTVMNLTANGITGTSVTLNWDVNAGAAGYEWVINNTASSPASGAAVGTNTVTDNALTPNTVYYAHVRVNCGSGTFSGWVTITFTTGPDGVATIPSAGSFNVSAYPNPAKDMVTVQISGVKGDNRKLDLTDVSGRVIRTVTMTTDKADIDMSDVAAGVYLIRYSDDLNTRIIKVNKQ